MAEKRMFSLSVVDTDWFLDLPLSSQALYFHLNMRADDDGFVDSPKSIIRKIGANANDYQLLLAKRFLLEFENGVLVIKHWRMHNTIQKDRYKPTRFQEEYNQLDVKEDKSYTEKDNVYKLETNCFPSNISKSKSNSISNNIEEENNINNIYKEEETITKSKSKRFVKPTIEEVKDYCLNERHNNVDWQKFYDYYESNGWKVGKNSMKDWKACVRTWERNTNPNQPKKEDWSDVTKAIKESNNTPYQYNEEDINF